MQPNCSAGQHVSRRNLLKGTLATSAGVPLANWGSLFSTKALAEQVQQKRKKCILLWMNGGASQFETFDMKPGRPTGGLFRPVNSNVPGADVCELMPAIARQMHRLTVIRSMRTSQVDHPGGIYLMHTGWQPTPNVRFPELGAVVAKYLGHEGGDLPGFIKLSSQGNAGSGFLGPKYMPFSLNADGQLPPYSLPRLEGEREQARHELRLFLEDRYAEQTAVETARMHRESYEAARRLKSAREVFDIDAEWEKNRSLYGDSGFGKRCLMARRLIESGVPFVEVGQSSYDSHADNFMWHRGLLPPMQQAWAGLLEDLDQRGLLEDTLVVWMGEIGRTPRINKRSGRDHYVRSWSTALAGCGVKGGVVYGASDKDGVDVQDNPVTEGDFFATVYTALGIDPTTNNYTGVRPIPLAQFNSKVISDILV